MSSASEIGDRALIGSSRGPRWRTRTRRLMLTLGRHTGLLSGGVIVLAMVMVALLAPRLTPHDPNRVSLVVRLLPPAWVDGGNPEFLLGTDQVGRDLFSRIIYGARVSLLVGLCSVVTSGVLGTALGVVAGYYGGWIDNLIMRLTDIQMALPFMLLALLVVSLLRPSLNNIIVVFTITAWYGYTRLARSQTLSLRSEQWIDAARVTGATDWRIIWRHILPQLVSPLLVFASLEVARIITSEAALGFLGLGVPPPTPTWGNMLADGREYMQDAWWISAFPGLTLMLTVLGINILGDALRDLLDPRLRH